MLPILSESAPSNRNAPSTTVRPACFPVTVSWMKSVPGPSCRLFHRNVGDPMSKVLSTLGIRSPLRLASVTSSEHALPPADVEARSASGQKPRTRICAASPVSRPERLSET